LSCENGSYPPGIFPIERSGIIHEVRGFADGRNKKQDQQSQAQKFVSPHVASPSSVIARSLQGVYWGGAQRKLLVKAGEFGLIKQLIPCSYSIRFPAYCTGKALYA